MSNVNPQPTNLNSAQSKDGDKTEKDAPAKSVAPLEEDDEFEDFPVEGLRSLLSLILTCQTGRKQNHSHSTQNQLGKRLLSRCGRKNGKTRQKKQISLFS